jgi:muramoyltetrapeptide carboxypeptidase
MLIKPRKLRKGDTIGLISPSSPLAAMLPYKVEKGTQTLEEMGFKVIVAENALKRREHAAGTPRERADDIHAMFANPEVEAVICFIGGFHSNQVLKYLDFDLIRKDPKIFMGFSDISVLHLAMNTQANLVTFYGPAVLTQFAEAFGMPSYTIESFKKVLMSTEPVGKVLPSTEWTDELLNWFAKADLERPRKMKKNIGYKWLKEGKCTGEITGGCITSILHLRGTKYWPDVKGKIFFWELPESSADLSKGEPPARIDAHLTDLELSGVFNQCVGMLIGRPKGYTDEQVKQLEEIIKERTEGYSFPILFNIDIGHTDPIITLPIGVKAKLDSASNAFEILEAAVTE